MPATSKRARERERAAAELRAADPVIAELIDRYGVQGLSDRRHAHPGDHYGALVRVIVGQQV